MSLCRSRRKNSLSAILRNFDNGDSESSASNSTFTKIRNKSDVCTAKIKQPKKDDSCPLLSTEFPDSCRQMKSLERSVFQRVGGGQDSEHGDVENQIITNTVEFCWDLRPVTPTLCSESFFHKMEPVKLFDTPKKPLVKDESKTTPETGTPLSLGIGSLLSPGDFLFSPSNLLATEETLETPDATALISELEALLDSGDAFSTQKDSDWHALDTPQGFTDRHFINLRNKSFADEARFTQQRGDDGKDRNKRKTTCQLRFETPCILRKRRRSHQCQKNVCTKICQLQTYTGEADSPFKAEAPFTPSRFLNSPQVVTSTPVSGRIQMTPSAKLNSTDLCKSPSMKRLLLSQLPRTPTPFKTTDKEEELSDIFDLLVSDDVRSKEDDIGLLPFSSYSGLETLGHQDPVLKTNVDKDITGCQMTLAKSLERPWQVSGVGNIFVESLVSLETPSKSLIGDESLRFSPPSIIRDTLHETLNFDQATPSNVSCHLVTAAENPPNSWANSGWERVACGQTITQMELVKQAKELLDKSRLQFRPRSLKL